MIESAAGLAAEGPRAAIEEGYSTGILPSQAIRDAIARGLITATQEIADAQVQPASLDLRLGSVAYRVQASFLPGPGVKVMDKVADLSLHKIDLTGGAVLEKGCVYIVPLLESLDLKKRLSAIANPKSSTGRLDIFARVITDEGREFDHIREGYSGPMWAEVSPRSFSILVETGARLVQLRLKRGSPRAGDTVSSTPLPPNRKELSSKKSASGIDRSCQPPPETAQGPVGLTTQLYWNSSSSG